MVLRYFVAVSMLRNPTCSGPIITARFAQDPTRDELTEKRRGVDRQQSRGRRAWNMPLIRHDVPQMCYAASSQGLFRKYREAVPSP